MTKFKTRTLSLIVLPEGEPIYSERGTIVEIEEEAAGEYVTIKQCDGSDPGGVRISPEEWPDVKNAIELMFYYISENELEHTESPAVIAV